MKQFVIFIVSLFATAATLLMAWQKDPSYSRTPTPGLAIYLAIAGFLMASVLIFSANLIVALSKGRKAKTEDELEAIVAPAIQGQEYDQRILKWTIIPRAIVSGISLGALCAAAIHYFLK